MANPYPDQPWREIAGLTYESPLVLTRAIDAVKTRRGEDANYIVARDYRVSFQLDEERRSITVPQGLITDLASVPRLTRWLVDRVGPHLEASIVHDYLYVAWQDIDGRGPRDDDRAFADRVMYEAMRAAGVGAVRANVIYGALRAFGGRAYREPNEPRYAPVPDF